MAIEKEILEQIIREAFPEATIKVIDMVGDGDHYMVDIKSEKFKDKTRIQQHKMVNNALKEHLGGTLHALSIKTSY